MNLLWTPHNLACLGALRAQIHCTYKPPYPTKQIWLALRNPECGPAGPPPALTTGVQGYLAHKKQPPPLGPP